MRAGGWQDLYYAQVLVVYEANLQAWVDMTERVVGAWMYENERVAGAWMHEKMN